MTALTLLVALLARPALTPEQAVALYEQGETTAACAAFEALYVQTAKGAAAWRRSLRYVGVCRFFEDDKPGATAAFDALLDAEPGATLSTDDFPPAVVEFYRRTQDRHVARAARVMPAQPSRRPPSPRSGPISSSAATAASASSC